MVKGSSQALQTDMLWRSESKELDEGVCQKFFGLDNLTLWPGNAALQDLVPVETGGVGTGSRRGWLRQGDQGYASDAHSSRWVKDRQRLNEGQK